MEPITFMQMGDLHISAPFKGLEPQIAQKRRQDVIETFHACINIVQQNNIQLLLITGDLFENEYITRPIIAEISHSFKSICHTRIFIAPGNHDYLNNSSFYINYPWPDNVHVFAKPCIERIDLADMPVSVYGLGWDRPEIHQPLLDNFRVTDPQRINIILIHGDAMMVGGSSSYLPLSRQQMKAWDADYIALGHIHRPLIINTEGRIMPPDAHDAGRIMAAYSGSTEPLDFGETGPHGVIIGNIAKGELIWNFTPVAKREYKALCLSIDGAQTVDDIIQLLINHTSAEERKKDIYSVTLSGRVDPQLMSDMIRINERLSQEFFSISIIDKTVADYDLEYIKAQHKGDIIGLFIENMQNEIAKADPKEAYRLQQALCVGLEALNPFYVTRR